MTVNRLHDHLPEHCLASTAVAAVGGAGAGDLRPVRREARVVDGVGGEDRREAGLHQVQQIAPVAAL